MVPIAEGSGRVAWPEPRSTLKVSSSSSRRSPLTVTEMVSTVSPGSKVTWPLVATKSTPLIAVLAVTL